MDDIIFFMNNFSNKVSTIKKLDGRKQRSSQSSDLIAQATIDIINSGNLNPTAKEVAAKAGLGTRTVFRQYTDMDDLYLRIHNIMMQKFRGNNELVHLNQSSLNERAERLLHSFINGYEANENIIRVTISRMHLSERLTHNHKEFLGLVSSFILTHLPELRTINSIKRENVIFEFSPSKWFALKSFHQYDNKVIRKMLLLSIKDLLSKIS
jgi:AcrR family transcriptional regulator